MSIMSFFWIFIKIFGNEDQRSKAFDDGYKKAINSRLDYFFKRINQEIVDQENAKVVINHLVSFYNTKLIIERKIMKKFWDYDNKDYAAIVAFRITSQFYSEMFMDRASLCVASLISKISCESSKLPLWRLKASLRKVKRGSKR